MKLCKLLESQYKTAEELIQIARKVGKELYDKPEAGMSGLVFHDDFEIMSGEEYYNTTDDGHIDTFDYVFFPSNGTGLDAADDKKVTDKKIRDKDGLLYIGGADGVKVVYFEDTPPDIKPLKKDIPKSNGKVEDILKSKNVKEFKKSVLGVWPNATFRERLQSVTLRSISVVINGKIIRCGMVFDKDSGERAPDYDINVPEKT